MPGEGRRILVTGVRGLAGRALAKQLTENGYVVFGTSRTEGASEPSQAPGLYQWRADDAQATRRLIETARPEIVFHLSGLARTFGPSLDDYRAANVAPTEELLGALASADAPPVAIILASSAAVYAPPTDEKPLAETSPLRPGGPYGVSKLEMEARAEAFAGDLPITLARFFNFTGPGQSEDFVAARIVGEISRGVRTLSLGATDRIREFNDVDAVATTLIRLANSATSGPVNIASGRGLSIDDLVAAAADIINCSIAVETDPSRLRKDDPPVVIGACDILQKAGAELVQPPIRDTLQRMLIRNGA